MQSRGLDRRDDRKRGHNSRARSLLRDGSRKLAAGLLLAGVGLAGPAAAKVPGQVHCYGGVCHRVRTVEEVARLVGKAETTITSYYDEAGRDRFNTGTVTSSGERFNAESSRRVSSSVYPDGTELLLWNPLNGRTSHVRVNDFGPFYYKRTLDVTRRIAEDLDFHKGGVISLKVIVIAAPNDAQARYRRNREYADTRGYLGVMTEPQVAALSGRLIAEARKRDFDFEQAIEVAAASAAVSGAAWTEQSAASASSEPAETTVANLPVNGSQPAAAAEPALEQPATAPSPAAAPPFWIALDTDAPQPKPLSQATAALMAHAVETARQPAATIAHADPSAVETQAQVPPARAAGAIPATVAADTRVPPATDVPATSTRVADAGAVAPPAPTVIAEAHDEGIPVLRDVLAGGSRILTEASGLVAMAINWRGAADHGSGSWWSAPDSSTPRAIITSLAALTLLWWARMGLVRTASARRRDEARVKPSTLERAGVGGSGTSARARLSPSAYSLSPAAAPAQSLTASLTAMGDRHNAAGRFAKAERRYRMALYVRERQRDPARADILADLRNLAEVVKRGHRQADTQRVLQRLIRLTERSPTGARPEFAAPLREWADTARDHGRTAEAEDAYARALAITEHNEANDPGAVADVLDERALLYIKQRRTGDALADAKRALALRWRMLPPSESSLAVSLSILAEARRHNGELLAAETAHREALSRFIRASGPDGLQAAGSMTSLAEVLTERGMIAEARQLLETAIPVLEGHLGLRHPGLANVHNVLANVHLAEGEIDTAVRLRRKSLAIIEHVLGPDDAECVAARSHLAELIDSHQGASGALRPAAAA